MVYGLSSRSATLHGAAKPFEQFGRLPLVQQEQIGVFQPSGGRIEIAARGNATPGHSDQFRLKRLAGGVGERAQQVPIGGRLEGHALPLALDNQPHGDALDPPGRQSRAYFPPQQGRNVIAIEAIDDAANLLGAD